MRALIVCIALFAGGACRSQASDSQAPTAASYVSATMRAASAPPSRNAMILERADFREKVPTRAPKIVRHADLRIEAADVRRSMLTVDSVVSLQSGLIADCRIANLEGGRNEGSILVRVPERGFTTLIASLRLIGRVRSEAVNSDDITKEYADLETRLLVKEEAVARLRRLLAGSTGKLQEVLAVETALTASVTELERLKGERRFDDERVAMSTVTVNLVEPLALVRAGFFDAVREQFRSSLLVLGSSVAQLVYFVTFLAPWLALATAIWRLLHHLRARGKLVS